MSQQPIKRSKAFMPLSREHHFDLLLAWKLRKGISYDIAPERISAYIQYLDAQMMREHFADEENEIFSLLPEDKLVLRAIKEHRQIRELISQIVEKGRGNTALFHQLADLVEAHVRFEERELFPYLEEKLSKGSLAEIESSIHEKHRGFNEIWPDTFWVEQR